MEVLDEVVEEEVKEEEDDEDEDDNVKEGVYVAEVADDVRTCKVGVEAE